MSVCLSVLGEGAWLPASPLSWSVIGLSGLNDLSFFQWDTDLLMLLFDVAVLDILNHFYCVV